MGRADPYTLANRQRIRDIIGFEENGPEQLEFLNADDQYIQCITGEQWGKSYGGGEAAVERMAEREFLNRPGIYWLVGAKYANTREEFTRVHANLKKMPGNLLIKEPQANPNLPRQLDLNDKTVIRTLSVERVENISMEAPDGILVCEGSQISLEAFFRLYGRTAPRNGWMIMTGTYEKAQPWWDDIFNDWTSRSGHRTFRFPSWTNRIFYPGGFNDPKIQRMKAMMPEDLFMERFGAKRRAQRGLVFGRLFDVIFHCQDNVDYIEGIPVEIAVDPGYSESAHAVLFIQRPPDQPIRIFDEIYLQGYGTEQIIELCQMKPWWKSVTGGVIDIAATKMIQSVTPPAEIWLEKGKRMLHSKHVGILDGIDRLKSFLIPHPITREPKVLINTKCKGLLSEFGAAVSPFTGKMDAYRYDMKSSEALSNKPKDRANHSIKALIYFLVIYYGYVNRPPAQVSVARVVRRRGGRIITPEDEKWYS